MGFNLDEFWNFLVLNIKERVMGPEVIVIEIGQKNKKE